MIVSLLAASVVSAHASTATGSSSRAPATGATLDPPRLLPGFGARLLKVVGLVLQDIDLLSEKLLNADQITRFRLVTKRVRQAFAPGSCGSTDAMDVHLGFVG